MKSIITCLLLIVLTCPLYSQWESMHGPEGGSVYSIYQNTSFYFINTSNGIYRSATGDQWEQLKLDIPKLYGIGLIAVTDSILYISLRAAYHQLDSSLLFRSLDQGESWIQLDAPHLYSADGLYALNETILYYGRSELYAGPDSIWISHDAGASWQLSTLSPVVEYIYNIFGSDESVIITAFGSKEFRLHPETDTWTDANLPDSIYYQTFFEFDSIWFAFTVEAGRMYRSTDDGQTWKLVSTKNWASGYPKMTETASAIYIHSFNSLYKSNDKGLTWAITSITDFECNALHPAPNGLYISNQDGLFLLTEHELSITPNNSGIVASRVHNLHLQEDQLWFTSSGHSISRLNTIANEYVFDLYSGGGIEDIVTLDDRVFALQDGRKVIRSNDNGATWQSVSPPQIYLPFYQLFTENHKLYLGGASDFIGGYIEPLITEDYGSHWIPLEIDMWSYSQPYLFARKGSLLFAAATKTIYRSNQSSIWETIPMDNYSDGDIIRLYACDNFIIAIFYNGAYQTFISSDEGDTWKEITFNPSSSTFYKGFNELICVGDNIIGTNNRRISEVFLSTDLGDTWQLFNEGLFGDFITGFEADDQYIYLASSGQGLWRRKVSDIQTVNTANIEPPNELSLFPNPSNGVFSFQSDITSSTKARYTITDITGKIIWSSTTLINPGINTIETRIEVTGAYLFSICTNAEIKTGKVIIQ